MRKKNTRTPTYDDSLGHLFTEISDFERTFAGSSSNLLQKKRRSVVADILTRSKPSQLRKALQRSLAFRKEKESLIKQSKPEREHSPENDVRVAGLLHRLPAIPASRLGPGSYNAQTQRLSQGVLFEQASRFPMTLRERLDSYKSHIHELTPDKKQEVVQRVRSNISAIKRYTPEERQKSLHEKALLEESRMSLTRLLHSEIVEATRKHREEELHCKLRKFEWRMKASDISEGKRKWASLVCAVGLLGGWLRKQMERKALHKRSQRVLKLLLQVSIAVGRIRRTVINKRQKRALAVLRRLSPFVVRWSKSHRKALIEQIAVTIEDSISRDTMSRIVAAWKRRIVTIQRNVRKWLMQRRMFNNLFVGQWNKYEKGLKDSKSRKAGAYTKAEVPEVPPAVKLILVSGLLRDKAIQHAARLREWKAECAALKQERCLLTEEDPLLELPPLSLPQCPQFSFVLSEGELASLAQTAEKKRSRWDRIVREQRPKSRPKVP